MLHKRTRKYDNEIKSNSGDDKAKKGSNTVPITHGTEAREIKGAPTEGPRSDGGRE